MQIFFISDHSGDRSFAIVENCWEEIIRLCALNASERARPPFEALSDKVCDLGSRFYPDESVFPLKFLISKLEYLSFQQAESGTSVPYGWLTKTLLSVKVPYSQIFQIYHDLFETKVIGLAYQLPPWSSSKSITHLVQNIVVIIEDWFEYIRSPSVGIYERYPTFNQSDEFSVRIIDEALSKYLVSIPVSSKGLITKLHGIQSRVRSSF